MRVTAPQTRLWRLVCACCARVKAKELCGFVLYWHEGVAA